MTQTLIAIGLLLLSHLWLAGIAGGGYWLLLRLPIPLLSADTRARGWQLVFLAATLLPLWLALHIGFKTPDAATVDIHTRVTATPQPGSRIEAVDAAAPGADHPLVSNSPEPGYITDQTAYLLSPLFTLLGLLYALLLAWGSWQLARAVRSSRRLFDESQPVPLPADLQPLIRYPVYSHAALTSPIAIGLSQPRILLPEGLAHQLTPQQLHQILAHEQAHHQRKDLYFTLAERLLSLLYWWSPLLPWLRRHLGLSREIACDRRATGQTGCEVDFAQALLLCARRQQPGGTNYLAADWASHDSLLQLRIRALLAGDTDHRHGPALFAVMALTLAAGSYLVSQPIDRLLAQADTQRMLRQYQLMPSQPATRMTAAIRRGDQQTILALVDSGVDINLPLARTGTALMQAVRQRDEALVRLLLSLGADPNQAAQRAGNPLILAAAYGHVAIAELLLAAGADINAVVPRDETPLINAAHAGQLAMVRFLVERGADIHLGVRTSIHDGLDYRTPLNRARTGAIREFLQARGAKG